METITRNVMLDAYVADRDVRDKVLWHIRLFRFVCRKVYSACAVAEMAGATFQENKKGYVEVVPNSKEVDQMIRDVFKGDNGKSKKPFYGIRQFARSFCETWMGIVGEAIQYNIVAPKWTSRDPEFPKARNGFMVTNGARPFARFQRIGIPIKNTSVKIGDRSLTMKWDFELGPVEFKIGKMDGSRHFKWKNIESGNWKIGFVYIKEVDDRDENTGKKRGRKISLLVSYTAPKEEFDIDPEKTMTVSFGDAPEMFINCSGQKSFEGDYISVLEAVNGVSSLRKIGEKYEACRASAGNPRRVWGSKKIYKGVQKKISNLTKRRSNYVKDRNHLWTRRIVSNSLRWQCGKVVVVNCPKEELFGQPWGWFMFKSFLEYKLKEIGAKVEFVEIKMEEDQAA